MDNRQFAAIVVVVAILAGAVGYALLNNATADKTEPERVGIIGAMEYEVEDIKKAMHTDYETAIADMYFSVGTLEGQDIVVAQCGMGKVNAGLCAQMLITKFNAKCIINTGAAGSLDESFRIGDFVVSTQTVQHDFDVSDIGYAKHEIPDTGKVYFDADADLVDLAVTALKAAAPYAVVEKGLICTGDQFIDTDAEKDAILADFAEGRCCEMEGGAVAQACYLNDIPFVIIRAISDDTSSEQFIDHVEEIGHECARAVIAMLKAM